jgi:soluble lytic murein transglycosylase-like protein
MSVRLLFLLVVACTCGFTLALDQTAEAETTRAVPPGAAATTPCALPERFREDFEVAAADAALPLALLVAVAKVESGFHPQARSRAGAVGLLQVLPSTAAELELDASRPDENVLAGARYLRRMFDRFGSADLALAAYNAGPGAVEELGPQPYAETVAYVEKVTDEWRKLVGCS